jgi:hypothetical protein
MERAKRLLTCAASNNSREDQPAHKQHYCQDMSQKLELTAVGETELIRVVTLWIDKRGSYYQHIRTGQERAPCEQYLKEQAAAANAAEERREKGGRDITQNLLWQPEAMYGRHADTSRR